MRRSEIVQCVSFSECTLARRVQGCIGINSHFSGADSNSEFTWAFSITQFTYKMHVTGNSPAVPRRRLPLSCLEIQRASVRRELGRVSEKADANPEKLPALRGSSGDPEPRDRPPTAFHARLSGRQTKRT